MPLMKTSLTKKIKSAPKVPGVYLFYQNRNLLYIGKAANLRNRLKSYLKITDIKTESLHNEATSLKILPLRSEIEALIEESRLIQKLKPKYNTIWRDDKSYLYVALTRQSYPKIFITHKTLNSKRYTLNPVLIGPFTDGNALRLVMKLLHRTFPYCTCMRPHLRDCINAQIGKCLGFCCLPTGDLPKGDKKSVLTRQHTTEYSRNIKMIKAILSSQSKKLLKTLTDEKEKAALEKIFEHKPYLKYLEDREKRTDLENEKIKSYPLSSILSSLRRVECYDNSHLAGKEAVGAMTVLKKIENRNQKIEFVPDKSQWRKFKIKSAPTRDDPKMIYEIVSRRLQHTEWPYPDLIIIDGGITQYRAARKAVSENPLAEKIKVVSFAKPQQKIIGLNKPSPELQKLVEQAIYQTHNFVIRYHRSVRNKTFLPR